MIGRRVVVTGRVQGVFYRASCEQEARARGVAGWVRNRSDGTVEAVFEGVEADVEAMIAWCRRGPAHADVDDVQITPEEPAGLAGFRVV